MFRFGVGIKVEGEGRPDGAGVTLEAAGWPPSTLDPVSLASPAASPRPLLPPQVPHSICPSRPAPCASVPALPSACKAVTVLPGDLPVTDFEVDGMGVWTVGWCGAGYWEP